MLTVDEYGAIRSGHRDGMSIKGLALKFNRSRNTIRKVLRHSEPNSIAGAASRRAPVLGPFHTTIDQILADDEKAPPASCHTAMQVHRRLQDEHGYGGCYGQVRAAMSSKHRRGQRETFIPLGHLPGQRLEADFGHIYVDFPEGRRLVPFLVTTWAYSNYPLRSKRCHSSAPRRSSRAWSPRLSSSGPFPRKSGGTTPKRWLP